MADVITRFRLETTQYDSKLRDAAKGLKEISRMAELGGKGFTSFTQKQVEAARAFGQTASGANNLKDKVKDLVGSFNDAAKAYNALTKEQQQTDFGKALAESLTTLKGRISEAKQELYGLGDAANKAVGGGGGLFGGGKIDGMLQVFGGNLMTKAAGALASLGSEMTDMVQQGVELAKQGEGIRMAFDRLGRGDILQGLREATHGTVTDLELMKAAVKFNDFKLPLDELGTMLAFAQQKAKDTGQSVDFLVESIVNGLGRKSKLILDNLGLSATEIDEKMKETGDMTKAVGEIIREQMAKAGDYVETAADRATRADVDLKNAMEDLGRTFQPLTDTGTSMFNSLKVSALNLLNGAIKPLIQAMSEAGILGQGARATAGYGRLGGDTKVDRMIGRLGSGKTAGAYSIYQRQLEEFDKYINKKRFQIAAYGSDNSGIAQSAKQRLQAELDGALKMRAEYVKRAQELHNKVPSPYEPATTSGGATGGKGGKGGGSATNINDKVLTGWQTAFNRSNLAIDGFQATSQPSEIWQALAKQAEEAADPLKDLTEAFKALNDSEGDTGKGNKPSKDNKTTEERISKLGSGLSAMASGLKAMGIELPDEINQLINIIQGVSSIIQGANAVISVFSNTAMTANTAALIANTAALQVASTTNLIPFFSRGGVVHAAGGVVAGNTYSGDQIPAMLNAGEVVLNRAQTGALASQLQDGGGGNGRIVGVLRGEDIALVADRWGRRTGKGELAFFK